MRVLVTGSAGFIGGYLVAELLNRGYRVTGLDNLSKYGPVYRAHDDHPRYTFVRGDAADPGTLDRTLEGCSQFIAGAAMVGGIPYVTRHCFDLLTTNNRIIAASCEAAIRARRKGSLRKMTYISSSSVYDSSPHWPTAEGDELRIPPSPSAYGLQKLGVEYHARAAFEQYGLPFTIVRPSNCVGIGETRALQAVELLSGNIKLATSHVVPDLVHKALRGQNPLRILGNGNQIRHYTFGGDTARGIVTAMESPVADNEDFNIANDRSTTVRELAQLILRKVNGRDVPVSLACDPSFPGDVRTRIPDTAKARRLLGFEADTDLEQMLEEFIPWFREALEQGIL